MVLELQVVIGQIEGVAVIEDDPDLRAVLACVDFHVRRAVAVVAVNGDDALVEDVESNEVHD